MTEIKMPQLGETIIEGTILQWLKKEGDTVARDEPLFEISTDKVDTEVPSPVAGTVSKILVAEGSTVPVEHRGDGDRSTGRRRAGSRSSRRPGPTEEAARRGAAEAGAAAPEVGSGRRRARQRRRRSADTSPGARSPSAPVRRRRGLPDRGPRSQVLSPLVRRLAEEHGVDLASVEGTGAGGGSRRRTCWRRRRRAGPRRSGSLRADRCRRDRGSRR